jgi:hypothetical protein
MTHKSHENPLIIADDPGRVPPEYKSEMLPLGPTFPVTRSIDARFCLPENQFQIRFNVFLFEICSEKRVTCCIGWTRETVICFWHFAFWITISPSYIKNIDSPAIPFITAPTYNMNILLGDLTQSILSNTEKLTQWETSQFVFFVYWG